MSEAIQEPQPTTNGKPVLLYGLIGVIVLLAAASIFLWLSLNDVTKQSKDLAASLTQTLVLSQQTQDELNATRQELVDLQTAHQALTAERDELVAENARMSALASLNEGQKFVIADALEWVGRQQGYSDPLLAIQAYLTANGGEYPTQCEAISHERYVHWADPASTLFVATPGKMGWSPYVGWSIRENVVFQPGDYYDAPGFVGSRGYELRYPLTGSFPLQELHTTINTFNYIVGPKEGIPDDTIQEVSLNCGVTGYVSNDANPSDPTVMVWFNIGGFESNVKLKYFNGDLNEAISYLTIAANLVIAELTSGL